MFQYSEGFADVMFKSFDAPYSPVQIDDAHKTKDLELEFLIEVGVVLSNLWYLLRSIELNDSKSWILLTAIVKRCLIDEVSDIVAYIVVSHVIVIDQIDWVSS